ncbi:dynein beta chain, ciliary-like [Lingula anatina]|uniref:Dynein beta chain, ciliary-like n=1 Tax=Lingula anatina TaxID=7574 RepID=A0A2R2MLD0_LINAN|nr:dynein beta chain, ciliary-like [Lingula anatina]|eukprot:XP_023931015.1 dynein beta chain, ciliary-like [Lingula anatina]
MLKGIEDEKEKQARKDKFSESEKLSLSQRDNKEKSETMSETMSYLGKGSLGHSSLRGSKYDLNIDNPQTPIPEEGGEHSETAEVPVEPHTDAPVDTMNLTNMDLIIVKKEQEEAIEEEIDPTELKLMLFPSQIQKISSLISLLARQRDLLERLSKKAESSNTNMMDSFDWQSQLRYTFEAEGRNIKIQCLDSDFEYGYEYMGSAQREVVTPLCEKAFFTLCQAVKANMGGLCMGPAASGKLETVHELSRSLGRPLYTFNCTAAMDSFMLHDIFRGFATTGSWICFNKLTMLDPTVLSVCAQLLTAVHDALRAQKTTINLGAEELPLNPQGACFALIDSSIKATAGVPEKLMLFNSAVSALPNELLDQFRTVTLTKPDLRLVVEVMLISQGFTRARELAHKTVLLYEMCSKLVGTNTPIKDNIKLGTEANEGSHGWSLQTLKYVASEAGAILDTMTCIEMEEEERNEAELAAEEVEPEKHEKEQQEKSQKGQLEVPQNLRKDEDEALVTSLRNTFMPRLLQKDASVFTTLVIDLWPNVDIPMEFGGLSKAESEAELMTSQQALADSVLPSRAESRKSGIKSAPGSKPASRGGKKSRGDSYKESGAKDSVPMNTPVVGMASALVGNFASLSEPVEKQPLEDINDAIAVATGDLGLMPGTAFQARVVQLSHLNTAHQTIIVTGPAGCGKSECIKTFAVAERERGKTISIQSIFTKALESEELLGYVDPYTKEWRDGLLPSLLRKFCIQSAAMNYDMNTKPVMKMLQLDGELDPVQLELMESILHNDGAIVLGNNERVIMPDNLRFMWEVDSLHNVSPSILATVGILCMTNQDVGWKLILAQWLEHRPETDRDLIKNFCDNYIPKILEYLGQCTSAPMEGKNETGMHYTRMIRQTDDNMITTLTGLFETLVAPYTDLSDVEYERYFNFACIWAFAGTLEYEHRESFNLWWRQEFESHIDYPEDGTVFDYMVDSESHEFCKWADIIPSYTATPHVGIPPEAFVHTVTTEQISYLLGLLSDVGKPVMLVGKDGCGKSAIVADRIRTVCSGEVAEVLALAVIANRFTNAKLLYSRLDERLEWKHGRTYVPKGNKRLMCLVDDLNLAQVDKYSNQSAVELVRQHIDDGGMYNTESHAWRYIKNVTYVTTVNPHPSASVPKLSQRLLRHFCVFGCPYPGNQEQHTIFNTLMHTHFITPEMSSLVTISASAAHHLEINDEKETARVQNVIREEEEALKKLIAQVVKVNVELQGKLKTMFLPTSQRCHYIFTMKDLLTVFRNLCLSLRPGCNKDSLLQLWQHECSWVYGQRMGTEVDRERYQTAFATAVRKEFSNEDQIQLLLKKKKPLFSNLIEQDSGMVTAGNIIQRSDVTPEQSKTDMYVSSTDEKRLKYLLERGVEEYNKAYPRIKLPLYRTVIEQVCRLARIVASPHEVAHTVLVADGDPGRCTIMARLAAHLSGFSVFSINPSPIASPVDYKMDVFKGELSAAYTKAGVRSEKTLFAIHEEDLLDEDFMVFLTEFVVNGAISHLYSYEEQTTIINSIRTEVTQAGLTYTREVAWEFFLKTVRKNFRICLIASSGGPNFQRICREYPAFTKNVNFIWFSHWSRQQLVNHASYHLKDVKWMNKIQKENIAHMLSSMHIAIHQQDGQEKGSGEYRHITNTTYEKFVERFISVANARHSEIGHSHDMVTKALEQIHRENTLATKLHKQLEHEKIVLEERKAGTIKILSQIGQDTAITEQQVKIVKSQMEKIQKLKKLLPEYQVAHERAVYKAIAIVGDTKKIVQEMDMESLHELRAMQKPIIDIEDLMAAIIMILKSPSADLTWHKGGKRQMANLERFTEELMSFDDNQLPESTLNLVEPYLKKPSFDPETILKKTATKACASLCKWVRGVVRYHRMMLSKVKPLHAKVEQTTQAVDNAEQKMNQLENKRKALDIRLADLAKGFEEATIDKNDQEEKTIKMDKMLETAARLRKILKREHLRCQQIHEGLRSRQIAIPGGSAIASAFTTYLGPYHYNFRRLMLTVHWPNCLRERGIPLVIDSIDHLRGRVIDFSIEGLKTAAGASGLPAIEEEEECLEEGKGPEAEGEEEGNEEQTDPAVEGALPEQEGTTVQQGQEQQDNAVATPRKSREGSRGPQDTGDQQQLARIQEEHENATEPSESGTDGGSIPLITAQQYNQYVRSLVKLLVGEKTLYEWIRKDFGPRQIENAAIAYSSWQRPPMLVDPYGEGISWLKWLNRSMNKKKLIILDVDTRSDPQVMVAIEKAIMKGRPVLLENCENNLDSMIMPLIHHRNTAYENDENEEPRMIRFCGRRILCHPDFRLNLATRSHKPQFSPHVASRTTLINYGMSGETLVEDLLSRAFARVRPELYKERKLALKNIHRQKEVLDRIMEYSKRDMLGHGDSWDEREVEFISDAQQKKTQMAQKLHETQLFLEELDMLKDELFPIARRGAMLYAILRSMSAVQREYQFTLPSFLALFDEAVGGDFPEEYYDESDAEDDYDDEDSTVQEQQGYRAGSTSTKSRTSHRQPKEDQSAKGSHYEHKSDVDSTGMGALSDKKTHGKGGGRSSRGDLAYEGDFEDEHNEGNTQQEEEGETDINDDPEKLPAWELPDIPDLPSEGVDYSSMAEDQVKTLVDAVTTTLYQHIKQSLYDEHALLFATMVTLNIQVEGGADFSDEELSLLLQGNPGIGMTLTLTDFESQASDPDWIAKDRWDDILAMSVLPGPLDAICCHIAEFSEAWKAWYNLPEPETAAMPNDKNEGEAENQPQKNTEEEDDGIPEDPDIPLTDFHRMLLVRMMRPDRTPAAMATYVNKYLAPHLTAGREPKLSDIQRLMKGNEYGLLVLLPPTPACSDQHPTSSLNMIEHPRETLLNMAKVGGIDVEHVVMGEGCEHQVEKALEEGQKKDCWILIENLHLSPQSFYKPLKNHLARLAKMIATEEKNTLVWITSEPSSRVPPQLIQCLHTLSWQFVGPQLVETPREEETIDLTFNFGSLKSVLPSAIAYALNTTPLSHWERVKTFSQPLKLLIYGVGVIQGALLARQTFGSQGLSQWSTLSRTHMVQVIDMVDGAVSRTKEPSVEELGPIISKMVYGNILVNAWDQDYSAALVAAVMKGLQAGAITLGDVQIPMPSAGTEPTDYGTWIVEQMKEDSNSLQALSLHTSVEKEYNESSGIEFLDHLDKLYETQNMDISSDVTPAKTVDTMKLRNAIDKCTESLPPLLMLGDAPQQETDEEYSFPYHWPSVVSLASASSTLMPESIGHVLLQECQWLNSLLCYIRQNIYDIRNSLVGGTESLPNPLKEAVFCLQEEYVPVTWVHPNKQPCTHTLDSWLTDLRKHYSQLNSWVKSGMVPTYDKEGNVSNSGIARGSLNVLWLGGLVKPQALFTALRQEKAVVMETTMDEIALSCEVLEGAVIEQMEVQDEGGLYIRDLLMQGACWDGENGSLAPATSFLYPMPLMYVKPVMRSELEEMKQQISLYDVPVFMNRVGGRYHTADQSVGDITQQISLYDVPVFMNRARQVCALTLPLASKDPVETWQLATVALILDPGVPEDAHRKPRKHAAVKAMPYHVGDADAARALSTRQANTADLFEGAESQMDARMSARSRLSARSYHSQMSYRPMSPRAPPLPPDLQMHREQVMTEVSDEPEQSPRSQAGSQQGQKQQTNLPQNKFPSNDSLGKQSQKSVGSRKKGSLNRPPSEQSRKSVEGGIATGPESRPLSRHSRDAEEGVTEGAQGQSPKASQAGSVKGQSPRASQAGSVKGQSPRASQAGSVKGQSPAASQAGSVKGESPRGGSQAGSVKGQPQGSEGQRSRRPSQQSATKESDENKSDSEKQASAGE